MSLVFQEKIWEIHLELTNHIIALFSMWLVWMVELVFSFFQEKYRLIPQLVGRQHWLGTAHFSFACSQGVYLFLLITSKKMWNVCPKDFSNMFVRKRGGTPQNFGIISLKSYSAQWHKVKPWEKYTRRKCFYLCITLLSSVAFAELSWVPLQFYYVSLQCYKQG